MQFSFPTSPVWLLFKFEFVKSSVLPCGSIADFLSSLEMGLHTPYMLPESCSIAPSKDELKYSSVLRMWLTWQVILMRLLLVSFSNWKLHTLGMFIYWWIKRENYPSESDGLQTLAFRIFWILGQDLVLFSMTLFFCWQNWVRKSLTQSRNTWLH